VPDQARTSRRRRRHFPSREAAFDAYLGRGAFETWPDEMLRDYLEAGFHDAPDGGVTLACSPEWEGNNFECARQVPWSVFEDSRCPIHMLIAPGSMRVEFRDQLAELRATGRIRVDMIPETTHFLSMERPELVRSAILEAVASSPP